MLAMVLQQVGLPVEGIALIIGVDRLLDMTRTAVNVTGDAMVSCLVGKSEKCLDETVYNDKNAGKDHQLTNSLPDRSVWLTNQTDLSTHSPTVLTA